MLQIPKLDAENMDLTLKRFVKEKLEKCMDTVFTRIFSTTGSFINGKINGFIKIFLHLLICQYLGPINQASFKLMMPFIVIP